MESIVYIRRISIFICAKRAHVVDNSVYGARRAYR